MIQNPVDYLSPLMSVPQVTPQAFSQGIQAGNGILDARTAGLQQQGMQQQQSQQAIAFQAAQEDRARAIAAAQAAKQQQLAMQQELTALSTNPNRSAQDYEALLIKYPQVKDRLEGGLKNATEKEKADELGLASGAGSALINGQPKIAAQMLRDAADADEAGGRKDKADAKRKLAELALADPAAAEFRLEGLVVGVGGKDGVKAMTDARESKSALAKSEADAKKAATEAKFAEEKELLEIKFKKASINKIFADMANDKKRLGIDADKARMQTLKDLKELDPTNLSASEQSAVAEAAGSARLLEARANKLDGLATEFSELGGLSNVGGIATNISEKVQGTIGYKSKENTANDKYVEVMGELAIARLPPGSASDKDTALAMAGFPARDSSASAKAAFIRKEEATTARESNAKRFESQYRAKNGGPGDARARMGVDGSTIPLVVDGVTIPPKKTFVEAQEIYREGRVVNRIGELAKDGKSQEEIKTQLIKEGWE